MASFCQSRGREYPNAHARPSLGEDAMLMAWHHTPPFSALANLATSLEDASSAPLAGSTARERRRMRIQLSLDL
eukprot:CAMPEP_0174717838 /NCGR_PEP_ID=MMETSP1094-20130205/27349_1 /TAXON_ID=156173 /ORGANISM="Chrysochromulina brevifilum, Strain UTEX LB 985" /LENGTH=73 /DNA_ID=CAMNT_0015917837 /DNA_START=214 /DNA_END=436 /DNA_ORIENTATION=-